MYTASQNRYNIMPYRRCGNSGLKLPAISLGLWQNFGADVPFESSRAMLRHAFDLGVTHFDLANNYGKPYGSAEITLGKVLREDLHTHRDELIISTKAGWDMWPGPYGDGGSRKYLTASLDQSLKRLGVDYVDIFYSHREDAETPLEETMGTLADAVKRGKALYVGVSQYSPERTKEAARILREMGVPCLIHQPSYNMFNRWVEKDGLLNVLKSEGMGCIAFSVLHQGFLSGKYLKGIPEHSRAAQLQSTCGDNFINQEDLNRVRALAEIAANRGQSLSQMAIAWVLRGERVTSALVGARSIGQITENIEAVRNLDFTQQELEAIHKILKAPDEY